MASIENIRQAIADTITAGASDEVFVYATVEDMTQVPAVIVEPATADFDTTFGASMDDWIFNVFVMCSRAYLPTGTNQLDGFCQGWGPNSVRRIIFETPDLGLPDDTDATVTGLRGYGGQWQTASIPHVGAILRVCVRTDPKSL